MITGKGSKQYNKGEGLVHHLGDKSVADVCEALIGAAFVHNYKAGEIWKPEMFDVAVRAVTRFVSSSDHTMESWVDYLQSYELPEYQTAEATASQLDMAAKVKEKIGYHFNYPRLLRSAFCHPSQPYSWEHIPSYQRLEFLGDSLLDTACVTHLFYRYPTKDPQWLTEHKMAMVANKFLGAICVKLGFHRHLRHCNSRVQYQVQEYVDEVQEAMRSAGDAVDYWMGVKDPPKVRESITSSL
jgi:endoribonuclease Dicer